MPVFEYVALNTAGKKVKGTLEADSIRTARQRLRSQNIFPTDIKEGAEASKHKSQDVKRYLRSDRVRLKDLTLATRLLATLSNAGLPLVSALLALSDQLQHQGLKRIVVDIKERVEQGSSLAKALAAYPKVFPRLYVNMVTSGEASGTLDTVLDNLADYYEAQLELRRKVSSALMYPVLMFTFCILVVLLLLAFVVPGIVEIFIKQKLELPLPTKIVIAFSDFILSYWWVLGLAVMFAILGARRYYESPNGRERIDRIILRLPIFGSIYTKVATARVASTLGTLLNGGVELLGAMDIVKNIVGNVHMRRALEEARDGIREGRNLNKELAKSGYFPPLLCQMIAIGEKSGKLESMLSKAGKNFTTETNAAIAGMTTLLEPLMIVLLGVMVLIIVISVLLPATELMNMMGPS